MEAIRQNSVFQCLDQSVGHAFRWVSWKGLLKDRFGEIEPWLMPIERLASNVPCEQTKLRNCSYRVVEHENGPSVGVCDEGRCQRRIFEKSELVLYQPNFNRFRAELARLMNLEPDNSVQPHPNVLPVGTAVVGSERIPVKLVGGLNPSSLVYTLVHFVLGDRRRHLLLLASSFGSKSGLKSYTDKVGWQSYSIEHSFTLHPRTLSWQPGAEAQWLEFKSSLLPPDKAQEEEGRKFFKAIQAELARIGREYGRLESENADLKKRLADQILAVGNKVEPEFLNWIITIVAAGSVHKAASVLEMPNSTLADRLNRYRDQGGLYRILYDLLAVRRKALGTRRLERFNEDYLRHQTGKPGGDANLIRDVINALEEQDEENWPAIRDELLDILKGHP